MYCEFSFNISFGNESFLNHGITLIDYAPIIIGDQVNIAPKVRIYTASPHSITDHRLVARPITIKDNVWIGGNVCILGEVTIGQNTIIGAVSAVTHDIPANVIAVGNPAHILRKLN